eukprot:1161684-Pelagomonas_calceolata.AAC.8
MEVLRAHLLTLDTSNKVAQFVASHSVGSHQAKARCRMGHVSPILGLLSVWASVPGLSNLYGLYSSPSWPQAVL